MKAVVNFSPFMAPGFTLFIYSPRHAGENQRGQEKEQEERQRQKGLTGNSFLRVKTVQKQGNSLALWPSFYCCQQLEKMFDQNICIIVFK